jgi:hypothetical protein
VAVHGDGFWSALDENGKPTPDHPLTRYAELVSDFVAFARDPACREKARRILIARYFEAEERIALYTMVGLPVPKEDEIKLDAVAVTTQPGVPTATAISKPHAGTHCPSFRRPCPSRTSVHGGPGVCQNARGRLAFFFGFFGTFAMIPGEIPPAFWEIAASLRFAQGGGLPLVGSHPILRRVTAVLGAVVHWTP